MAQDIFKKYVAWPINLSLMGLVVLSIVSPNTKLLAVFCVGCLAITIIKNPFLGIVLVMIMHFWLGSIEASIYPRILSIIFVGLVITPFLAIERKIKFEKTALDSKTKSILQISITIFLWEIFVNQVVHVQNFSVLTAATAKVFFPILLSVLVYLVIENKKRFEKYIFLLVLLISTSALVGILQTLEISWAWKLREMQGPVLNKPEPAGLALFSLHFSYQLGCALPLVFAMAMRQKIHRRENIFYVSASTLITVAVILSTVRSAILGALIGSVFVHFILRKYKKGLILLLTLTIAVLFIFFSMDISRFKPITTISDRSAALRIPLFFTALNVAKDNFLFGVGSGRFEEEAESYYRYVDHMRGARTIFVTTPHNQFLNTLVYFGVPGFLLLLLFYFRLFKGLILIQKTSQDTYYRFFSAGLLGSFISYIINSLFHNTGPFISDPYSWFFVAATFLLFKLQSGSKI